MTSRLIRKTLLLATDCNEILRNALTAVVSGPLMSPAEAVGGNNQV